MSELVDSHCHLDFEAFSRDLPDVIARARSAGICRLVTICTHLGDLARTVRIAESFPEVWFAAGTHPHNAANSDLITAEQLVRLAEHPKMVGIGETGLDYHYTRETERSQKASLYEHIEASRQTSLPLIVHARSADDDLCDILEREYRAGPFPCVMHCYASGRELAELSIDLGFYLSMSAIPTFRNARELRDIFRIIPLDRLLVETDAPYLAPAPYRGKRNEPSYVSLTATMGAKFLGVDPDRFASLTTANFRRLFGKVD